jgi:hypothetical protein
MTDEQRMYAIDKLEAALGLTGQPRVVVIHEKEGHEHCQHRLVADRPRPHGRDQRQQ